MNETTKIKFAMKNNEINHCVINLDNWRASRMKKDLPVESLEIAIELLSEYGKWVRNVTKNNH